jgi:hypothetical protein
MDSLIPAYRKLAETADGNFQGLSIINHTRSIGTLIRQVNARTLLDFGCGRGDAYRSPHKIHHQWGIPRQFVTLYDPAFYRMDTIPTGSFDIVVCSDVLEHIPEDEVDEFIARLFSHAKKAVWASVCCRPAKKFFPDTEVNLHVTQKPYDWWREAFDRAAPVGIRWTLVETP